jgi:hypothetical protein
VQGTRLARHAALLALLLLDQAYQPAQAASPGCEGHVDSITGGSDQVTTVCL